MNEAIEGGGESHHSPIDRYDGFLIDLDGVVYIGDYVVPGAPEAIVELRRHGKRVLFLTNDPRSSRAEYRRKLEAMHIAAVEADILTSGYATAVYIQDHEETRGGRAFVIGSAALKAEVQAVGLTLVGINEQEAEVVVVGGHEGFNYDELRAAARLVGSGARLYATGRDPTFPMPDGPWPATGAILAAVETATGILARVVGKPEPPMFEAARRLLPDCRRLVVIGDRLDSDIEGGRRAGLATILIADATPCTDGTGVVPDLTVPSLGSLVGR